jgi:ankyrin repeat protein
VTDDLLKSTPLGWAARWGKTEMVELFLKHGADKSLAGETWATPLAWAQKKGHTEIIELLK